MSYILTLALDATSFATLDALRRAHFPAERNLLPAHLTLFHRLPEETEADVAGAVALAAAATDAFALEFVRPRSLGRGVAIEVASPPLAALRRRLADAFEPWLTAQDAHGFRAHVTVQNKASAQAARALLAQLDAGWRAWHGRADGLLLWRYAGGPWEAVATHAFRSR